MPRSLANIAYTVLLSMLLVACASPAPVVEFVEVDTPTPPKAAKPPPVQKWLRWQETVSTMSASQLTTVLEGMAQPGNANQLFYYGLLNQQSELYDGWVMARDIFRELQQNDSLTPAQKRLAGLLEKYNQSLINGFTKHNELQHKYDDLSQELVGLSEQNKLLEQKIQVITDVESTISTRNEE